MTSTLDPEYNKMLSTPAPLEGLHKDMIDSLERQIDFYAGEANRLRRVRNSHVAISRLPAELLSDVFLYVVETGLERDDTNFAVGTFAFLQVCKRWNEIAVGFPQLWVRWIPGALDAWDLFKSRSKDAPLFLTWRSWLPESALSILMNILTNAETPRRIRQLDFDGPHRQLEQILSALDSRSASTTSSIRLRCFILHNDGGHITRFFSSFPKLSKLDINTFLPESSIFTTSNLTSLKLNFAHNDSRCHTQTKFLQVLQQHPNLKQLDLRGVFPSVENSRGLVPVLLPRLVDLELRGTDEAINGFVDLISMSSPLHNVIINFQHNHTRSVTALANTAKKILTAYYGCKGLEHPRKPAHLIFSSPPPNDHQIICAQSYSTPASDPIYNLELHFHGVRCVQVWEIILLFPLEHVREYTAGGLDLDSKDWFGMLRGMEGLLHLRLYRMAVAPMLSALIPGDEAKPDQPIVPKLESLYFRDADVFEAQYGLLIVLRGRHTYGAGLKSLVVRSCRVPTLGHRKELKGLVGKIIWKDMIEMESEYETETEGEADSEDEH